jgi:hypothetical protein
LEDPHTPVVFGGRLVQSALEQHPPLVGTQSVIPGHLRKPLVQVTSQLPPLQTAEPLAAGDGQLVHAAPQKFALVSPWQIPPQLCDPAGHAPLQALEFAMQAPAHSLVPFGQLG